MRRRPLPAIGILLISVSVGQAAEPEDTGRPVPVGVVFQKDTLYRSDGHGDNWCITWAANDPGNLTYQPKLSPKWISEDGKQMTLIWSDAMKNKEGRSHTVNYRWNQMRITIRTK